MNLNTLFEGAIDELEKRRIEDLEAKMDDLAQRARETKDPKVIAALRHDFAVAKAERDSYHYVREDEVEEGTMAAAEKHPDGPEFTGYWKGTDSATPGNKMVGSMEESAELDEMTYRDPGGFITWARKQGPRFAEFLHDPAVWDAAQDAYRQEREMAEAANPAQQAAIAVNMKKHHQKPKTEGAKVDRMVKHITKSEKATGKSAKDAEAIAWATANKRGYLDNANKKHDVEEGIAGNMQVRSTPMNLRTPKVPQISKAGKGPHNNALKKAQAKRVAENFVQWAVNEGYTNFTSNPAVYEQAKQAYKLNENLTKLSTEQLQAIWNSHKDEQRPSPALAMKLKAVTRELQRRKGMNEDLGSVISGATELWNVISLIKEYGLPVGLFAAAVGMYGLAKAAEYLEQGEDTFAQMARPAVKKVPPSEIHKITDKLNQAFAKVTSSNRNPNPMATAMDFTEEQLDEIKKGQKDSNGNSSCWTGYHAAGTKKGKNGGQVRNCVPNESIEEDWQKANKKDKTDGMSQKAVNAYKREHPGSKLKTAVTTKPSKLKKGSKDSKRRSSYCARSKGQMDMHNISCAKTPDKAICASRRRWNCESQEQFDTMLAEAIEKGNLQPGQYYVWTVYFDDGSKKQIKVTKDTFDPKAYYAKQNKNVINVDYNWEPHGE